MFLCNLGHEQEGEIARLRTGSSTQPPPTIHPQSPTGSGARENGDGRLRTGDPLLHINHMEVRGSMPGGVHVLLCTCRVVTACIHTHTHTHTRTYNQVDHQHQREAARRRERELVGKCIQLEEAKASLQTKINHLQVWVTSQRVVERERDTHTHTHTHTHARTQRALAGGSAAFGAQLAARGREPRVPQEHCVQIHDHRHGERQVRDIGSSNAR